MELNDVELIEYPRYELELLKKLHKKMQQSPLYKLRVAEWAQLSRPRAVNDLDIRPFLWSVENALDDIGVHCLPAKCHCHDPYYCTHNNTKLTKQALDRALRKRLRGT